MGLFDSLRRLLPGSRTSVESDDWVEDDLTDGDLSDATQADAGPWAVDSAGESTDDPASLKARVRFRDQAIELVNHWSDHALDFSPGSLRRLDGLVETHWDTERFRDVEFGDDDQFDAMVFTSLVVQLGGYFGEVLVGTLDATWEQDGERGWLVTIDDGESNVRANVFDVARQSLRGPASFAAAYDDVVRQVDVGDPISRDEYVLFDASVPAEDVTADDLSAYATALIDAYPRYDLDRSIESLSELDELVVAELLDETQMADEHTKQAVTQVVTELGSYFGEVLRAHHDAEWGCEDGTCVITVDVDAAVFSVNVFMAALDVLRGNTSFVDLYEHLMTPGESDTAETALQQAEGLPESWPDYDLDFTPESFADLDTIVSVEFVDEFSDLESGLAALLSHSLAFGSYFGEVIRRQHDATWVNGDGLQLLCPSGDGVTVDVTEVAAACFGGQQTFVEAYQEFLAETN